jgi:hypothetical protein
LGEVTKFSKFGGNPPEVDCPPCSFLFDHLFKILYDHECATIAGVWGELTRPDDEMPSNKYTWSMTHPSVF